MKAAAAALAAAIATAPAFAAQGSLRIPDRPSALAVSPDGNVLFVGTDRGYGTASVIAYRRDASGAFVQAGRVRIEAGVRALAVSAGGATVAIATRVGIATFSAATLLRGAEPDVHAVRDGDAASPSQIALAVDGVTAYYTNTAAGTLGVARIDEAGTPAVVAHIALDRAPQGIALSADGRTAYVVSEVQRDAAGAGGDAARLARMRCASNLGPSGVLEVFDTGAAVTDPEHAVVARIAAGCGPTRVAVTPDGATVWVTDRGEDRALAYDAARLRSGATHALIAAVDVGRMPIGVSVSSDGSRVAVADANRGADPDAPGARGTVSVIDAAAALAGRSDAVRTVRAGMQPRDIVAVPGGTFLVTSAGDKAVDAIATPESDGRNLHQ